MNNINTLSSSDQISENIPRLSKEAILPEDIGSDACPWLDEYIEFSRKWSPESFDDYHEACALAVLSIVAAGRVIFDLSGERKTNLNILLIGRTSIHAKSTASQIAKDLLAQADLDWFLAPDEITPQKLISDMSSFELPDNYNEMNDEDQKKAIHRTITAGQRGWIVDEFGDRISAMMQPDGIMAGIKGLIRTLDGAPKKYEYSTISRGRNLITNPYLPILGNITFADLSPFAKRGNTLWDDGFFARFATPTPPGDTLEFGRFPNQERIFPESLISTIVDWSNRLGFPKYQIVESQGKQIIKIDTIVQNHIKISEEVYEAFYEYRDALRLLIFSSQNQDLDGNYARFPEKALRIAVLFASINDCEIIEINHWAKAQAIAERWRVGLHELHKQINESYQDPAERLIKELSIEDQVLRAVNNKKMPDVREISQFTRHKKDIVKPAIEKVVSENKLKAISDNGKERFMLTK